jgi:hypothetical protein
LKITIQHVESRKSVTLFRKATFFDVNAMVRFSTEELSVIRARGLEDVVVLDRQPDAQALRNLAAGGTATFGNRSVLKISDLIYEVDSYSCDTPLEARAYETKLRDALRNLKAYIDANAVAKRGRETYEL